MAFSQRWGGILVVAGFDQFGEPVVERMTALGPHFYFWLGREAYPEPRLIERIVVRGAEQETTATA
jgi:hypothetical protein